VDLLDHFGTAQMEKDIEKNVMKLVGDNKKEMEAHTGVSTSITDENIKEYLQQVIEERRKKSSISASDMNNDYQLDKWNSI
jgi:hypothetical protein